MGGGVAGLSAAYFLRGKEWLLLEKEPQFGGKALQEEFEGQLYGTGSAYAYRGDEGHQLATEIGLKLPLVNMPDPTMVNKTYVPNTWKTGLEQFPYPKEVISSFKKFHDDIMKINVRKRWPSWTRNPSEISPPAMLRKSAMVGRLRPFELGGHRRRQLRVRRRR